MCLHLWTIIYPNETSLKAEENIPLPMFMLSQLPLNLPSEVPHNEEAMLFLLHHF